jgi:two-component system response regulator
MIEGNLILLVEDNPGDEEFALRALHLLQVPNQVIVVHDGEEAVNLLIGSPFNKKPALPCPPNVIFLDLKLPKLGGLDVLKQIRANIRTRHIPVVIFTSSNMEEDIQSSYLLGANSYVRKPIEFIQFSEAIQQMGLYWLTSNRVPVSCN